VSVLTIGVNSCAKKSSDDSKTTTDDTTTSDDDTTTTTITLSTTLADVIYQVITVKKEPKDHSIKYTSRTDKPTTTTGFGGITLASTLNFDNAQFGNSKFQ
jgi:hypothetical protein